MWYLSQSLRIILIIIPPANLLVQVLLTWYSGHTLCYWSKVEKTPVPHPWETHVYWQLSLYLKQENQEKDVSVQLESPNLFIWILVFFKISVRWYILQWRPFLRQWDWPNRHDHFSWHSWKVSEGEWGKWYKDGTLQHSAGALSFTSLAGPMTLEGWMSCWTGCNVSRLALHSVSLLQQRHQKTLRSENFYHWKQTSLWINGFIDELVPLQGASFWGLCNPRKSCFTDWT